MISIFAKGTDSATPLRHMEEMSFFDGIKNGQWQDEVIAYRTGKMEKKNLPALTPSGCFKTRNKDGLLEHSGIICLDIDAKDQIAKIDIEQIKNDQYTFAVHSSATGNGGYAVYVRIDKERHLDAFLGLEKYYETTFNIYLDKSCKDVTRLRFVSFDPDLYLNDKAKVFKKYVPKKEVKIQQSAVIVVESDFANAVDKASGLNLFDDYSDYIRLAFALSSEFGENGRAYFHALCSSSEKYNYNKADKDYTTAIQRDKTGVTIATVYKRFSDAGIKITSSRTEQLRTIAKLADNPKEYLKSINIQDDENIIEKFTNDNKDQTEIDLIIEFIKMSNIRFNQITRNYEFNGVEMTDRILSEFYTKIWMKIDDSIPKDKIFTLIQNRSVVKEYNPIHEWFERNRSVKTDNEFEKVCKCFEYNHTMFDENGQERFVTDYLEVYLKKWMLGLIGSIYGTYSLMILVLNGNQGTRKTEFFRNLLPKELSNYYAESQLDEGKDSEILMCKKWLIVDDEFGGKSKKDALKLKRLSSAQQFSIRMPYGRVSEDLNRIAVLAGTSNADDVINDPTGNRRIIPINVIHFDKAAYMKIDKTKLFIELFKEWEQDREAWFLTPEEIHFLNQSTVQNVEVMQEVEVINKHFFADVNGFMTSTDVKLWIEGKYPSLRTNTKRIGQALKICGHNQKMIKKNGVMFRIYQLFTDC